MMELDRIREKLSRVIAGRLGGGSPSPSEAVLKIPIPCYLDGEKIVYVLSPDRSQDDPGNKISFDVGEILDLLAWLYSWERIEESRNELLRSPLKVFQVSWGREVTTGREKAETFTQVGQFSLSAIEHFLRVLDNTLLEP